MKRVAAYTSALIAIDQAVKLVIIKYFANSAFVIVPGVLWFMPAQNTSLNWLASMLGTVMPVAAMVCIQALSSLIIIVSYGYLTEMYPRGRKTANAAFCFGMSAVTCSFIDVVIWGGSLDFLKLFNWFTFDLKDVFINCFVVLALITIYGFNNMRDALGKDEKKAYAVKPWLASKLRAGKRDRDAAK